MTSDRAPDGPAAPPNDRTPVSHPHPELTTPPTLPDNGLRVVALGGLGEVGRNMAVLETKGKLLVIDCGVLFPEDHHPGVDLILPDFTYIADRLDDIVAIVLTHGHEDHIGAVPYLLKLKGDIPIIGSTLTLALIEAKLKEHRIRPYTMAVKEGQREKLGVFDLEFVAVNHSIPDALAVFVRTEAGTLLHTGDFKMDQLPLDGRLTDLRAFARSARRASTSSSPTRRTPTSPASRRPSSRSRRPSTRSSGTPSAASSSRASAATCTASSRCSTRPRRPAARWPWSGARWCATWASPPSSATSGCPTASSSTSRRSTACATTSSSSSAPAPRASRWRPCRGWPTASTASTSAPATRCCWRAASSRATRTPSTGSSTA